MRTKQRRPHLPPLGEVDRRQRRRDEGGSPRAGGSAPLSPEEIEFANGLVLFRDDHVIALNKPAGLSSQGGRIAAHTLDDLLAAFAKKSGVKPRLVHRLDRATSGVILAARSQPAAAFLGKALMQRRVKKTYLAIVAPGAPAPPAGLIEAPLRRELQGREAYVRVSAADHEEAQTASTRYRTIASTAEAALVELTPMTGRMHQLRVHLASIGRPIAGDPRYGGALVLGGAPASRLMLHAASLEFPNPGGGQTCVAAPIPADMTALLAHLGLTPTTPPALEVKLLTVAPDDDGVRLDRWLRRRWPHLGQAHIHKLARGGQLRVDGARVKAQTRLTAGARVRVPPLPGVSAPPAAQPLSPRDAAFARSLVLFEDEAVLVLNKPAGLAVQGGTKTRAHIDALLGAWGEGDRRPRLVHRLDRDTSGVLILGKTAAAAARLAEAFARRTAHKTYWAIVEGVPRPAQGVIDLSLAKTGLADRQRITPAAWGEAGAQSASTEYATLAHSGAGAAWLALRPLTGRTHQLRAHMLAIGHPILGDRKYATPTSLAASAGLALQLHARHLVIPHPTGGLIDITAPIGPNLEAGLAKFGFDPQAASADPFEESGPPPAKRR